MLIMPTVSKPPEPTATLNGLLSAFALGQSHGDHPNALAFMDFATFNNPDASPLGPNPPDYTAVPGMMELDPTSLLSQAVEVTDYRNPTSTVAYTHHLRGMAYYQAISAQFAKFWAEYCVITQLALAEEANVESGQDLRLGKHRNIRVGTGSIAAFLAATGEITGGLINYSVHERIDVMAIFEKVKLEMETYIGCLDHTSFSLACDVVSESIGIGTIPEPVSDATAFLSAATFDALFAHPWKRVLVNQRARDLMSEALASRLEGGAQIDGDHDLNDMMLLAEGGDITMLPFASGIAGTNATTAIFNAVDARPPLTTAMYDTARAPEWLDQFYTTGDLVEAIFDTQQVALFAESSLSVALNLPGYQQQNSNGWEIMPGIAGTGALGSVNELLADRMNYITGMVDVFENAASLGSLGDSLTTQLLPNGLLYMGDCANATALNWISLLRYLTNAMPVELAKLFQSIDRSKVSLPWPTDSKLSIDSTDALIGDMVSSSIRDGYLSDLSLAFNVQRVSRTEQEGPILGATSVTQGTNNLEVSPVLLHGANGWGRVDGSQGIMLQNHLGQVFPVENPSSRFTGEFSAGRLCTWAPNLCNDAIAWGEGDVGDIVAENLLSMPCWEDGVPQIGAFTGVGLGFEERMTMSQTLVDQTNLTGLYQGSGQALRDQQGLATWENEHPTRGFKRGLACIMPETLAVSSNVASIRRIDPATTLTATDGVLTLRWVPTLDDGHGFADSTGASAPKLTWYWDPCRAQIVGQSWRRWAGTMFQDTLVHPFVPQPIAVSTAPLTLADINTRVYLPREREVHAAFVYPDAAGITTGVLGPDGVTQALQANGHVATDGRVESDPGSSCNMMVLGYSDHNPAMVTGTAQFALEQEPTAGALVGAFFDATSTAATGDMSLLPAFDANISIKSGCQGVWNHLGAVGCNATNNVSIGSLAVPTYNVGVLAGIPTRWEGRHEVPVGDGTGHHFVTVVDGCGLLHEDNPWAAYVIRPYSWLMSMYTGYDPLTITSGSLGIMQGNQYAPFMSVLSSHVGISTANNNPLAVAGDNYHEGAKSPVPGVRQVENPWMRKGLELTQIEAETREANKLVTPWVRADGEDGFVHARYSGSELGGFFSEWRGNLLGFGSELQSGLSHSLWMELQQIN